jgi:NAD(P)-dependent dehydrogenase (short-subunit alcohol dehydrogenase family)
MAEGQIAGKVAVVTGANSGIGKVTARHLAGLGATVVLACRNPQRAEAARREIAAATGSDRLHVVLLDLASFASVREAARDIAITFPKVHVLINNAGYLPGRREVSAIGIEQSFLVNYLSPFLLTNLLLPALQTAEEGRIINISSAVHRLVKIPWDDLACARRYGPYYAYSIGKLGNVMFTHELARRLAHDGSSRVTVNALHPGYIASGFGDHTHWYIRLLIRSVRPLLSSPERGAALPIYLATAPQLRGVTGNYFKGGRIGRASRYSQDPAECDRLWRLSCALTGLEAGTHG